MPELIANRLKIRKKEIMKDMFCHSGEETSVVLHRDDWASHDQIWRGSFEGRKIGTGITVIFFSTDEIGKGPRWHVHPYDEVFIVRKGRAFFTIGDQMVQASEGDILLGPANIPHKFHNLGPGRLETTDIHLSDRWIQSDLEDGALQSREKNK